MSCRTITPEDLDKKGFRWLFGVLCAVSAGAMLTGALGVGAMLAVLLLAIAVSQLRLPARPSRPTKFKPVRVNPEIAEGVTSAPYVFFVITMLLAVMGMADALLR